ncbi:MAG: hypothetical protein R2845_14440 [Thermomicrobiales bacterium]
MSLPTDSLEGETDDASVYGVPEYLSAPALRTRPDQELVQRAADAIAQAERPVIVAGGGVLTSQAWDALTLFAESLNIPVATSINGKGVWRKRVRFRSVSWAETALASTRMRSLPKAIW